jgi:hypothetical protein
MEGQVFNMLTVVALHSRDKNYNKRWVCKCECGNESIVLGDKLKSGETKSCGCYGAKFREKLKQKAAVERRAQTKSSYHKMINKCHNETYTTYKKYGAVGITVCDRWRFGVNTLNGWECFFADMGPKPENYVLGRKDKNLHYTPENSIWVPLHSNEADYINEGAFKKPPKQYASPQEAWAYRARLNSKRQLLTLDDIKKVIVSHCPLLNVELSYDLYEKNIVPSNYATLDRINPKLGYTPDNIQVISRRANTIKNDATLEELKLIVKNWEANVQGTP